VSRAPALLLALAVAGAGLVALALVTARRPAAAVPSLDGYFDRWSPLHGGYDPRTGSAFARGWLTMVHAIARPLARRGVLPDVVTLSSVWLAGLVLVLADVGGRWPLLAGAVLVVSGLFDTLDGCVAVLEDRTTAWGYVLDSAVDRVNDAVYLLAAVVLGCPVGLAAGLGFGFFFLEYLRARAGNAGGDTVGRVTVGERPTRVIVLAPTVIACGVLPDRAGLLTVVGCAVLLVLTVVGVAQLGVAVRRQLAGLPARPEA
jgi:CDP-diacylglycerol--glycerol-3-phosphate 3-phosphatidyltransferase